MLKKDTPCKFKSKETSSAIDKGERCITKNKGKNFMISDSIHHETKNLIFV